MSNAAATNQVLLSIIKGEKMKSETETETTSNAQFIANACEFMANPDESGGVVFERWDDACTDTSLVDLEQFLARRGFETLTIKDGEDSICRVSNMPWDEWINELQSS